MKRCFLIAGILFLSYVQMITASEFTRKLMRVNLSEISENTMIDLLEFGLDIISYRATENTLEFIIHNNEELTRIEKIGIAGQVIQEDIDSYSALLKQQDYLDNFHTYDQMLTELRTIQAAYPGIAKLYDIGDSWEKQRGLADRDIWAMKISDNVDLEEQFECEVLYIALHHAREIITPEILLYFINYLVANYGIDERASYIVNNRQLWLVPMMNPDGHNYVFTYDMWWRKNRRNNGDGTYGVDLNRNWGYAWGYDNSGSSPYPSSSTYRGPAAFSEPETQAIRDLTLAHKFIISLSYHSYSQLILFPWGYIRQSTPDNETFVEIADSIVAYNNYTPQAAWQLYIVNGGSDDWLYGEQTEKNKIYAITPEVGTQFHPDTSVIMKEILENLGPNLYVAYAADQFSPLHQITHTPLQNTADPFGPYRVKASITPFCVRLDTTNFFIHFNTTGIAPFESLALTATENPGEYGADIPGFGDNVTIYYYLSASDAINRVVYFPAAAPDTLCSFTVQPDTIAPSIVHTPLEDQCQYQENFLITAEIADDLGIADTYWSYRLNGGELDSVQLVIDTSSVYQAWIPVSFDSGDVVEYKIVATDHARLPNIATHPDSGFHRFEIIDHFIFTFEKSNGEFTASDPGWEWGIPFSGPDSAYSGVKVWATNLDGNYADSSQLFLDSPVINLKNFPCAKLEFYHYFDFDSSAGKYFDGGNVKISEDNGQTWSLIRPAFDYPGDSVVALTEPGYGAQSGDWTYAEFDLNSYLGKEIKIRFHFGSDFENNRPGWYLDNIAIKPQLITAVNENKNSNLNLPLNYSLSQNYPNPFNANTSFTFSLPKEERVILKIYNIVGQEIILLVDEVRPAGKHVVNWDGTDASGLPISSGIYLSQIRIGEFEKTKKMVLIR